MGLNARRRRNAAALDRFAWDGPLVFEDPETTKGWDESKHPRRPSGSDAGGEFAPAGVVPEAGGHPITGGSDAGPRALLARMAEEAKAGGFTYNPRTGKVPTEGFSVGVAFDDKSTASYDAANFSVADVEAFWQANAARMADSRVYIGGWLDEGKVWLDVTRVYPKDMKDVAIRVGRKRNQIAIADLGAIGKGDWDHAFVNTGGDGAVVKSALDYDTGRGHVAKGGQAHYFLFEPGASPREVHAAIMAACNTTKAWEEDKHPRHPAGNEQGGEFAPAGAAGAAAGSGSGGTRSKRPADLEDLDLTDEQIALSERVLATVNDETGVTYAQALAYGVGAQQTIEDSSPEREAHRVAVQAAYMESHGWATTPTGHQFDYIMGVPGAGKSSMVQGAQDKFHSFHIDQDQIKALLNGYDGGRGAVAVHEEAALIADRIFALAGREGRNVIVEGTGKTLANAQALVEDAKKAGYRVTLHVVSLDSDEAVSRAASRFKRTGRPVPLRMMWKMRGVPEKNFDILAKQTGVVDEAIHWDNNVKRGEPARKVRHVTNGVRKGHHDGGGRPAARGTGAGQRSWTDLGAGSAHGGADPRAVPGYRTHPAPEALNGSLPERRLKFNPHHAPAGSPAGGEFTTGPLVEDHEARSLAYAQSALRLRARAAAHLARGGSADQYDRMIAFAEGHARKAAEHAARAHAGWRARRAAAEGLFVKGMIGPGDVHVDGPLGSESPTKRRRRMPAKSPADRYTIGPVLQEAVKALRASNGYVPLYKAQAADQRIVCGWASIIAEPDGTPIVDRHGEVIEEHELVLAEREFMRDHRVLGKQHQLFDGQGEVIESLVVTKQAKLDLGLPDYVPIGWLIAAKVWDDALWADAKAGNLPAFSIGGSARPEPYGQAGS